MVSTAAYKWLIWIKLSFTQANVILNGVIDMIELSFYFYDISITRSSQHGLTGYQGFT